VLMLAVAPAQVKPEDLFKTMEEKIVKAKTLEAVQIVSIEGPNKAKVTLNLALAEGNKANVSIDVETEGKTPGPFGVISDGKHIKPVPAPFLATSEPTPKQLNEVYAVLLTRLGIVGINEKELLLKEFDRNKALAVSDFKLGKKEKVGDKEAQAVEYVVSLDVGSRKGKIPVTVWLDPKTNLPLKRSKIVEENDKKATVTEVFKELKLGEKIDPKKFEFPKE
jgi:outer membrane lipoprotein-sorting protein